MAANLPSKGVQAHEPPRRVPAIFAFIVEVPKSNLHLISATLKPKDHHRTNSGLARGLCRSAEHFNLSTDFSCIMMQPPLCRGMQNSTDLSSDSFNLQFPNTGLRSCTERSDIKPVRLTNVRSAVAHSCRSVQPTPL